MSNLSIYTRLMVETYKDSVGNPTGGMSLFNSRPIFTDAEEIDIDIKRGNGRKASLVRRYDEAVNLGKQTNGSRFSSVARMFPLIESTSSVSKRDLVGRQFGDLPQVTRSIQAKALLKAREIHNRHIEENAREMERLAWESVLTGEMTVYGVDKLSFFRRPDHQVTVANAWDGASATILEDMKTSIKKIRSHGHMTADVCIMGAGSYDAFIKDTEVKALMDTQNEMHLFKFNAENSKYKRFKDNGFVLGGVIKFPTVGELYILTYPDVYENDAGIETNYLLDNQVIIMSSNCRMDRYYGPSDVMPSVIKIPEILGGNNFKQVPAYKGSNDIIQGRMFFSDARGSENGKGFILRTQVAPIFAPISIDGIVVLDTLV